MFLCDNVNDTENDIAMVKPDTTTFNIVLGAFARTNRVEEVQSLIQFISECNDLDLSPDLVSYNTILNMYAKNGNGVGAENLLCSMIKKMENNTDCSRTVCPDVISFNTVMCAYARSRRIDCHIDVIRIFTKMSSTPISPNSPETLKPDKFSYTTLIDAFARSGNPEAPYMAEDVVFKTMKESGVQPDVSTYNALMYAWLKSRVPGSVTRAHEILLHMLENSNIRSSEEEKLLFSRHSDMENVDTVPITEPDAKSYTILIDAYAKSREQQSPQLAQELFTLMEERCEQTDDIYLRPSIFTFTSVINAWGRSKEKKKAQRALDMLNHMKDHYKHGGNYAAQPIHAYNADRKSVV